MPIMKKVVASGGKAMLADHVLPEVSPAEIQVRVLYSTISAGTELGILTASANNSGAQFNLGYQAVGRIEVCGADMARDFAPGEIVACYGAPYVFHARSLNVPRHLTAKVPQSLANDSASLCQTAFCGLGTIALHGFRCGCLSLGETAAVIGLGVLGNLVAQAAAAAGCRVAACDTIDTRRHAACECGITACASLEELRALVMDGSSGHGADTVYLAVNKADDSLVTDAISLLRDRGRMVIVGTTAASLPRESMFNKEASIIVSRAGGPGRYDEQYEAAGHDYPYAHARWTEGRNLEEYVRLLAQGRMRIAPLVTDVVPVSGAGHVYDDIRDNPARHIGVVMDWSREP